jgi:hypothetical protein
LQERIEAKPSDEEMKRLLERKQELHRIRIGL